MFRHRNEYPAEGELPAFDGATGWLGSEPLIPQALAAQVVLVSFGTYTCIGLVPAGLDEAGGAIRFRFHARDVHLVLGPPAGHPPVRFAVHLDGEPPGRAHGVDVDESGTGTADYQRMYQLIRQPAPIGDRLFEIEFLDAGVEAFVFTFG